MITGMMIHAKGWRSGYCSPDPRAFLGCGALADPAAMSQQKRWATGFLEILFSKTNPIFACFTSKLQFRQCLAYLWILIWGLRSIPEVCYAALPAYCIITNSSFLPKVINSYAYFRCTFNQPTNRIMTCVASTTDSGIGHMHTCNTFCDLQSVYFIRLHSYWLPNRFMVG